MLNAKGMTYYPSAAEHQISNRPAAARLVDRTPVIHRSTALLTRANAIRSIRWMTVRPCLWLVIDDSICELTITLPEIQTRISIASGIRCS